MGQRVNTTNKQEVTSHLLYLATLHSDALWDNDGLFPVQITESGFNIPLKGKISDIPTLSCHSIVTEPSVNHSLSVRS